ncbi:MAG: hypothetical protein M3253_01440 [Chloroflexota bacterium]|nr:hypothetical protein [Chloroflexota bacterium]
MRPTRNFPAGTLVVAYCGRGAVVWRDGRLRFAGRRDQSRRELEAAVAALLEMERVDLSSVDEVRDALLTIAGARVLREPVGESHQQHS